MELMEEDVKAADLVLWVGISFQQSASTMYFREVRAWIQVGARQDCGCRVECCASANECEGGCVGVGSAESCEGGCRV
jgi:hypothetical protein